MNQQTMLVSTPVRRYRLDRVALAQAASPAPARAAGAVPRAAVGLLYVLFEDARLLLAVVVCVNRTSKATRCEFGEMRSVDGVDINAS